MIEPRQSPTGETLDLAVVSHVFDGTDTINGAPGAQHRRVAPGNDVRLRLVNTDDNPKRFLLCPGRRSACSRSTAPTSTGRHRSSATSARARRGRPVRRRLHDARRPRRARRRGDADAPRAEPGRANGRATRTEARRRPSTRSATAAPPRRRSTRGAPSSASSASRSAASRGSSTASRGCSGRSTGASIPDVPMLDGRARRPRVCVEVVNSTSKVHPMHLHGHHALVLSRDGRPSTGSPWWTRHPGRRAGRALRARLPRRQPRPLDGALPQPGPRGRRADDAPGRTWASPPRFARGATPTITLSNAYRARAGRSAAPLGHREHAA